MLEAHPEVKDEVYMWTWSPAGPACGNGEWGNSNDCMRMTHVNGMIFSMKFVPTDFYDCTPLQLYSTGISCLAKLDNGNAFPDDGLGEAKCEDLHIDIEKCKLSLTRKTKAIMPVHIYGMACNMPEIMEFAKNHKLLVIEDAAQAIGVKWGKKHAGTFGQVGSFSFFADKTITTGEGGLVVTNDKKIYERLQFIRNQGRINRGSFVHPEIGYNFRMTDIQSAIGLSQLEKLPEIIEKKSTILKTYKKYLKSSIKIIQPPKQSNHIPFRVAIVIPGGSDKLMKHMAENGIENRTFFYPLHLQPCYSKSSSNIFKKIFSKFFNVKDKYEISTKMYNEGICLPSFVGITEEQIKFICEKINEYV